MDLELLCKMQQNRFHGAMNVKYLMKMWRLFKTSKTPNYHHLRRAIMGEMIWWADKQQCWIEEGVYFHNKSLDEWIALKFNPGDSTALYSSVDKGISILKCRALTADRRKFGMSPREMQLTSRW